MLEDIGAADVPQILVFNKLDAIEIARKPLQLNDVFELKDAFSGASRRVERVFVSALTSEGLPQLRALLAARAAPTVEIKPSSLLGNVV